MNAMLQKLTSIRITFWCLGLLVLALLSGVLVSLDPGHAAAMKSLNRQLPLVWLTNEGAQNPGLAAWFVLVCLIAGIFFIHLACCVFMRMLTVIQHNTGFRQWLFFLIHVMFALVMLCHGLSMVTGYKISGVAMTAGESVSFKEGYTLTLSDVRFFDDNAILKAPYDRQRLMMTRENIHRWKNYADISLTQHGRPVLSGRLFMLAPLTAGPIQITLKDFFYAQKPAQESLGVKLVITKNPLTTLFFTAYALMILSLAGFVVLTWRNERPPTAIGFGNTANHQPRDRSRS